MGTAAVASTIANYRVRSVLLKKSIDCLNHVSRAKHAACDNVIIRHSMLPLALLSSLASWMGGRRA